MQATERGSSATNVTTEEGKPFDRTQEPRTDAAPRAPRTGGFRERKASSGGFGAPKTA